ncbi:MAG: hypothetical protein WAW06_05145 [bacterium]
MKLLALAKMVSIYGSVEPLGIFIGNLKVPFTRKPYVVIQSPPEGDPIILGHFRNA